MTVPEKFDLFMHPLRTYVKTSACFFNAFKRSSTIFKVRLRFLPSTRQFFQTPRRRFYYFPRNESADFQVIVLIYRLWDLCFLIIIHRFILFI